MLALLSTQALGEGKHPTTLVPLGGVDAIIEQAITDANIPGAVLVVGHDGAVIYRKAYGNRALEPKPEAMTLDTVFDLASLTKVIATTTAMMQLFEQGRVRMNDPVAKYLPEFAQNGKEDITLRQLMTHYSGLAPDLDLKEPWTGKDTGYAMAFAEAPQTAPGSRRRIKAGDEALFCGGKGEIAPCFELNSGTAGVDCFGMHRGLPRSCSGRICKGERLRWTDDAAGRKEHTPRG